MVRRAAAGLIVFLSAAAAFAQRPAFSVLADRSVAISLPDRVLADDAVRRQLDSGLTTTFLVAAGVRGTRGVRLVRVEVRYDLWDEVWLARRYDFEGRVDSQRLASRDALQKWWASPVRLLPPMAERVALDIQLTVVPFSAAEEEDARAWITKSGGVGTLGGGGIVDAMIGSTITARPITTMRWRIDLSVK